jgi:hypothetical protein
MGNISNAVLFPAGKDLSAGSQFTQKKSAQKSAESSYQAALLKRKANAQTKEPVDPSKRFSATSAQSFSALQSDYLKSIRETRTSKKKTGLAKKKLQYSFKKVSSEIMRSKTPSAAKSAASKARREVLRLKRLKANGEYDAEELEAAITHAKAMERIAKKKAAHLEQEEMIQVTDDGSGTLSLKDALKAESRENESEENPEDESDFSEEEIADSAETGDAAAQQEAIREQMQAELEYQLELAQQEAQAMQEELAAEMSEQMAELMTEISEEMQEMMEQFDMMEMLSGPVGKMNSQDFEMLKTKHRTDEMKEIAKADKEYLKVIFDKLQREKNGGSTAAVRSSGGVSMGSSSPVSISDALSSVNINIPDASGAAASAVTGMEGAMVDISV